MLKIKFLTLQLREEKGTSAMISSLSINVLMRALPLSAWVVFGAEVFGKGLARTAYGKFLGLPLIWWVIRYEVISIACVVVDSHENSETGQNLHVSQGNVM